MAEIESGNNWRILRLLKGVRELLDRQYKWVKSKVVSVGRQLVSVLKKPSQQEFQGKKTKKEEQPSGNTTLFKAWVPTPRGFIDLGDKMQNIDDKGIIKKVYKNSLGADGIGTRIFYMFSRFEVTIEVEEKEFSKEDNEKIEGIKGKIIFGKSMRVWKVINDIWSVILILICAIFLACIGVLHLKVSELLSNVQEWVSLGVLGILDIIVVGMVMFCWAMWRKGKKLHKGDNKVEDYGIKFTLQNTGIMDIDVKYSDKDRKSNSREVAKHAYHAVCHILKLHRNVFHDVYDDNLLLPQPVSSDSKGERNDNLWAERFLKNLYQDVERARMDGDECDLVSARGTLEYITVFRDILSRKPKDNEKSCFMNISIESEKRILVAASKYNKVKNLKTLRAIEIKENQIHRTRGIIIGMVSIFIGSLIIFSLYIDRLKYNSGIQSDKIEMTMDNVIKNSKKILEIGGDGFGSSFISIGILAAVVYFFSGISVGTFTLVTRVYSYVIGVIILTWQVAFKYMDTNITIGYKKRYKKTARWLNKINLDIFTREEVEITDKEKIRDKNNWVIWGLIVGVVLTFTLMGVILLNILPVMINSPIARAIDGKKPVNMKSVGKVLSTVGGYIY